MTSVDLRRKVEALISLQYLFVENCICPHQTKCKLSPNYTMICDIGLNMVKYKILYKQRIKLGMLFWIVYEVFTVKYCLISEAFAREFLLKCRCFECAFL